MPTTVDRAVRTLIGYVARPRPIALRCYWPADDHVRSAVILCPPLGQEEFHTRRTFRLLGEQLAARNIAVASPDYDGTGESAGGYLDPHRVDAWLDTLTATATELRRSGVSRISLVGIRVGALLAAQVADRIDAAELVLWDPFATGEQFLRAQRALYALSLDHQPNLTVTYPAEEPTAGSESTLFEGPGLLLDHEATDDVRDLTLAGAHPHGAKVLLVHRGKAPDARISAQLAGTDPVLLRSDEQPALLEVTTPQARVPQRTLDAVADWLVHQARDAPLVTLSPPPISDHMTHGGVTERVVTLAPTGLVGVLATSDSDGDAVGGPATRPPTMVFLNAGSEHRAGPGRLWVDLSREWAVLGLSCLRVDLSGLGDSPDRIGYPHDQSYSPYALEDVRDVVTGMSGDVVLVGLCSGGYHAIEGALGVGVAGVLALNPYLGIGEDLPVALDAPPRLGMPPRPMLPRRLAHQGPLLDKLPQGAWRVLSAIGAHRAPSAIVQALFRAAPDSLVVLGDADAVPVDKRGGWLLTDAETRVHRVAGMDHSLLLSTPRREVAATLTAFVRTTWLSGVSRAKTADDQRPARRHPVRPARHPG